MSPVRIDVDKVPNFVIENGILKSTETISVGPQVKNYGELLLENMLSNPRHVGQVDGLTGRKETFSEMSEKSVKCAMWLKKQNIQSGDVIGICTHNHLDMYIPYIATLYVGAAANSWWDIGLNKDVAKHFINITKPKVLFANEVSARIAQEVINEMNVEIKIVIFGSLPGFPSLDDILSSQDVKRVPEFRCTKLSSPNDPAIIMYTSGSSGLPKSALFTHKCLHANVPPLWTYGAPKGPTTSMTFSSLSWLTGVYCMFKGIITPHTRIIYPEFTEEKCFHLIQEYKVNWLILGTPAAFRLQKSPLITNYDLSSVKYIYLGGGVVKKEIQKAVAESFPRAFITQGYGSTELGFVAIEQYRNCKSGSCGTVTANTVMKVIDPATGKVLGPNQEGEACFKSLYMMAGYYGNPAETKKVIDSEGWLHTGDLMYYDEDGYIYYVDRIKELIKCRGCHVSPAVIEQLLQGHPAVKEAAVLSVPHIIDEEHPVAFISKVPNVQVTEEELKQLVSDRLPDQMKLRGGVRFFDDLPHTTSGKVARAELRKLARSSVRYQFADEQCSPCTNQARINLGQSVEVGV